MKKILMMLTIVAIAAACNLKTETKEQSSEVKTVKVEFADFMKDPSKFIDQKVEITAIASHVCKHGGQKLFLVQGETEESIKVVTGENMAAFSTDLEGNTLKVIGMVDELRIDETYLKEWEAEIEAEVNHDHAEGEAAHAHAGKGEEADLGEHKSDIESIANFRKQIAESGTDHLSFYSIVCEKYEIVSKAE